VAEDNVAILDHWRSFYEALAILNGDDPDLAVKRHREWCIKQGFEKEIED
jgi:hypothetical protein